MTVCGISKILPNSSPRPATQRYSIRFVCPTSWLVAASCSLHGPLRFEELSFHASRWTLPCGDDGPSLRDHCLPHCSLSKADVSQRTPEDGWAQTRQGETRHEGNRARRGCSLPSHSRKFFWGCLFPSAGISISTSSLPSSCSISV